MTDPSDLTHELAVEVCHPLKASVDRSIPMQETTSVDHARTRTLLVPRGDRKAVKWDLDVECAKCQKAVGLTISQHSVMFLRAKDLPAGTRIERTLSRRFLKGELLAAAFITVFWLAAAFALLWYFLRFDVWSPVVIGVAASTWIVLLVYLALAGLKNWRIGEGLIVVESHEFPEHQAPRANMITHVALKTEASKRVRHALEDISLDIGRLNLTDELQAPRILHSYYAPQFPKEKDRAIDDPRERNPFLDLSKRKILTYGTLHRELPKTILLAGMSSLAIGGVMLVRLAQLFLQGRSDEPTTLRELILFIFVFPVLFAGGSMVWLWFTSRDP